MESPSDSDLPAEIIQEILLRLPVKTLLRFKCVCKHWYALIGSPSFVKQHFDHESNQDKLLIRHDGANGKKFAYALFVDDMYSGYEEPDHLQMPDMVYDLMGPVNGVFCVVGQLKEMALLNPAMRQMKPLPLLHWKCQPHLFFFEDFLGFGLDVLSGVYKVVVIQCFWDEEMDVQHYPPLVAVYDSGSESWRHLEGVDSINSLSYAYRSLCNTYLDGVYYWLMESDDETLGVLAFDMSCEKFQELPIPDCTPSKDFLCMLALDGDSIALLAYDFSNMIGKCVDIWVMEKDGCWSKSYVVGPLQGVDWPVGFSKNHELLIEARAPLLTLYDASTQKSRTVEFRGSENGFLMNWIFYYKESLFCIKGEGGNCKLWDPRSDFVKDFFK